MLQTLTKKKKNIQDFSIPYFKIHHELLQPVLDKKPPPIINNKIIPRRGRIDLVGLLRFRQIGSHDPEPVMIRHVMNLL